MSSLCTKFRRDAIGEAGGAATVAAGPKAKASTGGRGSKLRSHQILTVPGPELCVEDTKVLPDRFLSFKELKQGESKTKYTQNNRMFHNLNGYHLLGTRLFPLGALQA